MKLRSVIVPALVLAMWMSPFIPVVRAQEQDDAKEDVVSNLWQEFWDAESVTGNWGGARDQLKDFGFQYSPFLVTNSQANFRGGSNTHNAHETTGRLFHNFELDFDKMVGLEGATFFLRVNQSWGDGIVADVGALSSPYWGSGSPTDLSLDIDKYWWRQRLFDNRFEFRLGKLVALIDHFDQNKYAIAYNVTFMNRALNYSLNIPWVVGLGAFGKWWVADWAYVQGMVIDPDTVHTRNRHGTGGFDTAFHGRDRFRAFWEAGILPHEMPGASGVFSLQGNYRFGGWYDPNPKTVFFDDLNGLRATQTRSGDVGWYLSIDQLLWAESDDPEKEQGLGVFARYGYARGDVNRYEHVWSTGVSYKGIIPNRDRDVLAFGVAQSIISDQYKETVSENLDRETIYELYYAMRLTEWCIVTPDLQAITNPGGSKDDRDAFVGGIRILVKF